MIPRATQEKLATDHPDGTKHKAKIDIALPLLGEGLPAEAVVMTLREKFPKATEAEIRGVVNWCQNKNPTPSVNGHPEAAGYPRTTFPAVPATRSSPKKLAANLVNGCVSHLTSPVELNGDQAGQFLRSLYGAEEYVNIVCKFTTVEKKGEIKANPSGAGKTQKRDWWLKFFSEKGVPFGEAGAWIRPNPVLEHGSGADGAITNADVTDYRFLLLESDVLSLEEQLAVYEKLQLPLAAILTSGGKSAHAWLTLDAEDAEDYAEKAQRILAILAPLGFDQANKNPSRLSRLPGVVRKIGGTGEGKQELLYLNPKAEAITELEIERLMIRVQPPKYVAKSMPDAIEDSLDLYQDIYRNKIKSGLRTGFPRFDGITGGLKRGWLTVIAGATNVGKSSFVLNIINHVLAGGSRVALFSFEMDYLEINDVLFAQVGGVDRNKFNHGYFAAADFGLISSAALKMKQYRLDVYDDPQIRLADLTQICLAMDGLALVVLDYLQMIAVDGYRDNREQQVASLSRGAKALAKTLKCPVIALSQLNEEGKVRESRAIGHDANCVIVLEEDDGQIEAKVVKGRSIPKGSFYFDFQPEICRFTETGCDEKLQRLVPQERPN